MKDVVKVAAIQIDIHPGNPDANLNKMWETTERAMKEGAPDLVVFPALVNRGELAEEIPGPFTQALGENAKRYSIHLVAGLLEKDAKNPGMAYNSAALIGPSGQVLGVQRQVHTVGAEKQQFNRGDSIETFATELGTIGLIVGTDFEFPEVARVQTLQGAEILCMLLNRTAPAANLPDLIYYLAACRAWENKVFEICCNRVGSADGLRFGGRSCIVGTNGQPLAHSEEETEDILMASLDREKFYEDRADRPYFRDRRPEHYGLLAKK